MLEKLRSKRGADRLSIICGNFADVPVTGTFDLIYVVFSFSYLLTQAEQLRCFCNVSQRLTERGAFVIQNPVPGDSIFRESGNLEGVADVPSAVGTTSNSIMLFTSQTDLVQQLVKHRIVVIGNEGAKVYSHQSRYVWPAELDLMAQIAGLRLEERWDNWKQDRFTSQSKAPISIYRRKD